MFALPQNLALHARRLIGFYKHAKQTKSATFEHDLRQQIRFFFSLVFAVYQLRARR